MTSFELVGGLELNITMGHDEDSIMVFDLAFTFKAIPCVSGAVCLL